MTGFVPARLSIFKLAFSHKSNQATKDYAQTNNERLEYLGDAVLGTIVAEYLFKKYPNGDEGFLTKMRSKIVKRKSLNHIGDQMGLDVLLSEYNRTRLSSSMLGNAVEALVGAVYLEKGYRGTKRFVIQRMLKLYVDMHELETVDDNYKSQLLEYCQKNGTQVNYKLLNKFKQDRRDRFKVAVIINGEQLSLADDFNKKSAEQLASLRALQKLGLIDKVVSAPTGRKSPVKDSFSTKKQSKKAAVAERKPKSAPKRTTRQNGNVSEEQLAVAKISKQQATKSDDTGSTAPVAPKGTPPASKRAAPAAKRTVTGATLPPKKLRRNNSRLGRSIWNGIQTAGASISLVDGMGFVETQDSPAKKPAPPKKRPKASTPPAKSAEKKTNRSKGTNNSVSSETSRSSKGKVLSIEKTHQESRPTRTRKRRPIPLRLLTPIVKDASAVMAIDFASLFDDAKPKRSASKPQARKIERKPRKKPSLKPEKQPASRQNKPAQSTAESAWEDTPLGLSADPATSTSQGAPKVKTRVKEVQVHTEELDKWEDTLLEISAAPGEQDSNLPKMYKKSGGKATPNRRRPQRRSTNRKKNTEE